MEEVTSLKQMFHMMDKDKNGHLTFEELKEGLHINGERVPEPDLQMLMEAVSLLMLHI